MQILEEKDSPFNGKIKVVRTLEGVRITVEGVSQSGWLVKKVWDSALKKIKKKKGAVGEVLVLGLGGGSVARLVNKYWPNAEIIGVDIDPVMVELGKKYLGLGEVNNLKIVIEDAQSWVNGAWKKRLFDLILVDIYRGARIPEKFTTSGFIKRINGILKHGGIAAFNHLYSGTEKKEADSLGKKLHKIFPALTIVKPEANIIFIGYKE